MRLAKAGPSGIPARSDDVPGVGDVVLFRLDGLTLVPNVSVRAFNPFSDPIPPGRLVLIDSLDGKWFVVTVDCD